jgi:hypothetical protein
MSTAIDAFSASTSLGSLPGSVHQQPNQGHGLFRRVGRRAAEFALRLPVMPDFARDGGRAGGISSRDEAMIAAARCTFADIDVVVGKMGIRYFARS